MQQGDGGGASTGICPQGSPPSSWIGRYAPLIASDGSGAGLVLDLAAGSGRHSRLLRRMGFSVLAIDRDVSGLADLADDPGVDILEADLESGGPPPFAGRSFAGIVVTNYLHRPLLPALAAALAPGGLMLYETFARGNEHFGKPSNPAFLLGPGELLEFAASFDLGILDYFGGEVSEPGPAIIQRLAARKP